jgi:hypothetical protein
VFFLELDICILETWKLTHPYLSGSIQTMLFYCFDCETSFLPIKSSFKCTSCKSALTGRASREQIDLFHRDFMPFYRQFGFPPTFIDTFLKITKTRVLFNTAQKEVRRLGSVSPTETDLECVEMLVRNIPDNTDFLSDLMSFNNYHPSKTNENEYCNGSGKTIRVVLFPEDMKMGPLMNLIQSRCA